MHQFAYRYPRFMIDLPVEFVQEDQTLSGRCSDISAAGMKILFPHALEKDASGRIVFSFAGRSMDIPARVVYTGSQSSGLEFVRETSEQQKAISELIDTLAGGQQRGVVIVMDRGWGDEVGERG